MVGPAGTEGPAAGEKHVWVVVMAEQPITLADFADRILRTRDWRAEIDRQMVEAAEFMRIYPPVPKPWYWRHWWRVGRNVGDWLIDLGRAIGGCN